MNEVSESSVNVSNAESLSSASTKHTSETFDSHKIYLSVVWYGGCLGAAYYETDTCIIHMLLETRESKSFEQLENLIEELSPIAIVTSAKQDESFVAKIKQIIDPNNDSTTISEEGTANETEANFSPRCVLDMLSSSEYRYETSKRRIFEVRLPIIPDKCEDSHRAMILSSVIPFDCDATVRATGGLIRYLGRKRVSVGLENEEVQTPISSFQTFSLKHALYIDKASASALQIFKRVSHPSAFKLGSRESLSMFVLLNRTSTFMGRRLMKTWFHRPTSDKSILSRRMDAVSFLIQPRFEEVSIALKENLRHVKNISRTLTKVQTGLRHSINEWTGLQKTVLCSLSIADTCRGVLLSLNPSIVPVVFKDVVQTFTQDLVQVVSLISDTMDEEMSKKEGRFVVKPRISQDLDRKKDLFAKIPAVLCEVANREVVAFQDHISSCQILYMRRVGYLMFIRKADMRNTNGDLEIPGLDLVADSDETVFYKSRATKLLDQEFGDVLGDIAEEEDAIESELQQKVLEHGSKFLDVMRLTAELDCLLAFATVAKEHSLVRPRFVDSNEIHIIGGRHLIQEQSVAMFVPNHAHFGPNNGLVKILTGPNASGKSVYLKQVGLIVFMAHIGSFVPAEAAEIGKITRIFTVTKGRESVCSGVSSFATDLGQISTAVREADQNSLVLIDEFGKGTATVDGVALLTAFLSYCIDKGQDSPLVLCATHFHSLVRQSLLPRHSNVKYITMDTMQDEDSADTVFLYKLVEGVSKCSEAAHVARLARVPDDIVTRGQEVSELIRHNAPVRRFNRVSTLTYLKKCRDIAGDACRSQLDTTNETKRLLSYAQRRLSSPKRKRKHLDSSVTESSALSSDTESSVRASMSSVHQEWTRNL